MCWISKSAPIKLIAEKDIPVFKIVEKTNQGRNYWSIYYERLYHLGEKVTSKIEIRDIYKIERGLHSYIPEVKLILCGDYLSIKDLRGWYVDGFSLSLFNLAKMNCIIPKGSEYYVNERGEVVSNQLKVIGFEEINEKITI